MFDRAGLQRSRRIGKHRWVVTRTVDAAAPDAQDVEA